MFACPSRRAFLSCSSNAPTTSRRLISTATANSFRPQPQRPSRRYSSSSSSNSKPFGPGNRGLASKTGAFRKRDRQLENGRNTQTVAPPIPGPVSEVEVVNSESHVIAEEGPQSQPVKNTLPFVARTDHLHESDVRISTFFALHRPVSISFPVPGHYSNASFQKLFDAPTPTSAIELYKNQLETQARANLGASSQSPEQDANIQEELLSYTKKALLSGTKAEQKAIVESPIQLSNHILSGEYRPFQPPPPPEPISEEASNANAKQVSFHKLKGFEVFTQTLKSVDGQPAGFVVSFIQKQDQEGSAAVKGKGRIRVSMRSKLPTLQALSVKRQRKLKMKKHKYKKLMKRTRTLRRKLEKQ
ncbi:hypothetical protein ABW19_dt0200292 [Dactylella cylindrospora]|nr:hypothetical protein ABW19_dt0200292 [Dactylella cylindrospora]